jgi:lipopolysaccharide/colanic/teichoic acid biosynthesis glycosyltransferase
MVIKLTSKGPVFFIQKRVGLDGRIFKIIKFRTMQKDAEKIKLHLIGFNEADGPAFKIPKDPRVTKVGRILRKTGLDELPQIWNVIKGDMSLVGPRPPLESEVRKYENWQHRRLSVKPGITCIWQVQPNRHDIPFNDWMRMDMEYIDTWSVRLDTILIFKTIKSIFVAGGH